MTVPARLRPMQMTDLAAVLTWRNHPSVSQYMYTQHTISPEEHRQWFDSACRNDNKHLLIYEHDRQPTGFINLTLADPTSQRANWGFYLSPDAPKGSGSRLGRLALAYAFEDLRLHKVCGEALAYNSRSIRFHERLGFRQEACLRDHHFDGTHYHDVIGFGLLQDEWHYPQGETYHDDA